MKYYLERTGPKAYAPVGARRGEIAKVQVKIKLFSALSANSAVKKLFLC